MQFFDPDIDRAFPYQVEITVPDLRKLEIMQAWCICKRYRTRTLSSSSETLMQWCFADVDDAESFRAAFTGNVAKSSLVSQIEGTGKSRRR